MFHVKHCQLRRRRETEMFHVKQWCRPRTSESAVSRETMRRRALGRNDRFRYTAKKMGMRFSCGRTQLAPCRNRRHFRLMTSHAPQERPGRFFFFRRGGRFPFSGGKYFHAHLTRTHVSCRTFHGVRLTPHPSAAHNRTADHGDRSGAVCARSARSVHSRHFLGASAACARHHSHQGGAVARPLDASARRPPDSAAVVSSGDV